MKKSMKTECADRTGGNRQKEDVEKAEEETDTDRQIDRNILRVSLCTIRGTRAIRQ